MKRLSGTDWLVRLPRCRVRGRVARLWYSLAAFVAVWVFLCTGMMHAQQPKPKEYEVKAAYLYNFGRFVRWPADVPAAPDNSFPICVLGQDRQRQIILSLFVCSAKILLARLSIRLL